MQSHILLPKLYLLRKHACRRTIRHTRCMCHTCSRITCCASWICPTGRYAGMQRHNAPHRHRIVCHAHMHVVTYPPKQASTRLDAITYAVTQCCICHTSMHAAAKSATQACMHVIMCHTGKHTAQCSRTFYYTCYTSINTFP